MYGWDELINNELYDSLEEDYDYEDEYNFPWDTDNPDDENLEAI